MASVCSQDGWGREFSWIRVPEQLLGKGQDRGGTITIAVGVGMMIFLYSVPDPDARFAYRVGLIPLLIGTVLLGNALFSAHKD